MDIATIIGIISGFGLIVGAIAMKGNLLGFLDFPSVAIVIGGTVAAILVMFPLDVVLRSIRVGTKAFFSRTPAYEDLINQVVRLADKARREGLLVLEKAETDNEFLKKGCRLVADGSAPHLVRSVMETEINFMKQRHRRGQAVFKGLGLVAPAFGMIGTLIGLVQMLGSLSNPDEIGPAMAVALLTTFYGAVMANLLFLPMAKKLEERSVDESLFMEIIMDGVLSIQNGENPRIISERLYAFLAPALREEEK